MTDPQLGAFHATTGYHRALPPISQSPCLGSCVSSLLYSVVWPDVIKISCSLIVESSVACFSNMVARLVSYLHVRCWIDSSRCWMNTGRCSSRGSCGGGRSGMGSGARVATIGGAGDLVCVRSAIDRRQFVAIVSAVEVILVSFLSCAHVVGCNSGAATTCGLGCSWCSNARHRSSMATAGQLLEWIAGQVEQRRLVLSGFELFGFSQVSLADTCDLGLYTIVSCVQQHGGELSY